MPFSIAMSFIIALVCFAYTMISIYRYITSSFALLERIQTSAPETWEALGQPEKIYVKGGGSSSGGMYMVKPLWPWLKWIWVADTRGLDHRVSRELEETSQLLKKGLVAFGITIISFLYMTVVVPSS